MENQTDFESASMMKNIRELDHRGYSAQIDHFTNETEWFKGDLVVSIHTLRSCSPAYFCAVLDQKEKTGFQFEVIEPK